jgi:hypothetical protein
LLQAHPVSVSSSACSADASGSQVACGPTCIEQQRLLRDADFKLLVWAALGPRAQVAASAKFLAYALKSSSGSIRVLDLLCGTRALLRGHPAGISDVQARARLRMRGQLSEG